MLGCGGQSSTPPVSPLQPSPLGFSRAVTRSGPVELPEPPELPLPDPLAPLELPFEPLLPAVPSAPASLDPLPEPEPELLLPLLVPPSPFQSVVLAVVAHDIVSTIHPSPNRRARRVPAGLVSGPRAISIFMFPLVHLHGVTRTIFTFVAVLPGAA